MNYKNQKGVALITVFLIMTIILAIVLGVNIILLNKVKLIGGIDKPLYAFDAAYGGAEKALYYNANGNLCNAGNNCPTDANDPNGDFATHCNHFSATPIQVGGCDLTTCSNCAIYFDAVWGNNQHSVSTNVTPSGATVQSIGTFGEVSREVTVQSTVGGGDPPNI